MTTYTITQEQRETLMNTADSAYCYELLKSLQPNTQEPAGWLIDGLDVVMSHARAQAEQAEHHAMGGTAVAYPIYTHPAPQTKPQEPALYQSRIRPAWKDDADWFAWETCSRESAEEYERTPLLHDWQYQVRRLYEHPAPQQPAKTNWSELVQWWESGGEQWDVLQNIVTRMVNTAAPQAKPLTDEQIQGIWNVSSGSLPGWRRHITYACAIEAAHNIGVETKP